MKSEKFDHEKKYGLATAISLVIANMVGTGVFTSLGFQVMGLSQGLTIVLLWSLGGLVALLGALSYSELGQRIPKSGGEYRYLSDIYHPSVGFLSGWISLMIGFAAPVAAASMACGSYFAKYLEHIGYSVDSKLVSSAMAVSVILALSAVHCVSKKQGAQIQNILTALKIAFIVFFIIGGFVCSAPQANSFDWNPKVSQELMSSAFAISFFFVSYAYSGWNASSYIASEIHNPKKNLPLSLLVGTGFVTLLYVLLNSVFMKVIPLNALKDSTGGPVIDVGAVFAHFAFGQTWGLIFSLIISFLLLSTVSSMIITGPRVAQVLGQDTPLFKFLSIQNRKDIPWVAILFQCVLSILYIISSSFDQLIVMIGFILNIFTFLSVLGLFISKRPEGQSKAHWFVFPVAPILFLLINSWMLWFGFHAKTKESLIGLSITLLGAVIWFFARKKK